MSVDAGELYFLNVDLSEVFSVEDKFRVVPRLDHLSYRKFEIRDSESLTD